MPATTDWTFDGSQFVGSVATTSRLELRAGFSHVCQPSDSGFPGKPPRNAMSPELNLGVHHLRVRLAQLAGVLADDGEVVLARPGHEAPGIGRDRNAGVGRFLHHRQHRVTEVRIGDDQVDLLRDRRLEVGDALVQVRVGALVDDLPDLRIGERLEDELHLRHLAEDVLTELLDVGDGELAAGARAAAVVLPALERQVVVDLSLGAAEPGERDVA